MNTNWSYKTLFQGALTPIFSLFTSLPHSIPVSTTEHKTKRKHLAPGARRYREKYVTFSKKKYTNTHGYKCAWINSEKTVKTQLQHSFARGAVWQ
jgi:hypothetical protein